jgi:WxL interacting protein linking bacterial and host surfaces
MSLGKSPRPRRASRRIRLAAAIAAASLCLGSVALGASAGGIGLRPAHFDPADPSTRAYFKPKVAPGGTFTDEVVVSNTSDAAIDLLVAGVDGLTAQTTGAVYANRQDPVKRAGAWVTPAAATLTVQPRSEKTMGFTVRVPAGVVPGDHLAGIAFENAHPTTSGGNFAVTEIVRAVMGIQIQTPGPAGFRVHLDNAALQLQPGTATASVAVTIGNDGLKLGKPTLTATLSGPDGYRKTVERQLDTILPGDTVEYPLPWPDTLPAGNYTINATATGDGPPARGEWAANVTSALPGAATASGATGQASAPAGDSGSGFPTWLIAVVAVAGIGGGILIGRRGRRSPPAPPPAPPAPDQSPTSPDGRNNVGAQP